MNTNINGSALATANSYLLGANTVPQNGQLTLREKAEIAFKSNFYSDLKNAEQAIMKFLVADDLGIPLTVALQGVYIIDGKPVVGANIIAAKIQSSGRYRYKVKKHDTTICELECLVKFDKDWELVGIESFSIEDAKKAGLTGKQNWVKYPKNMLFARAISNSIKFHFPDLFFGTPVYTPDEMGATVDENGNVITFENKEESQAFEKAKKIEVEIIKSEVAETPAATTRRAKKQKEVLEEHVVVDEQPESNTEPQAKDEPKAPTRKELFAQIKTLMDMPELDLTQEKCRIMFKESYGCDINAASVEQIQEFLDTITPF